MSSGLAAELASVIAGARTAMDDNKAAALRASLVVARTTTNSVVPRSASSENTPPPPSLQKNKKKKKKKAPLKAISLENANSEVKKKKKTTTRPSVFVDPTGGLSRSLVRLDKETNNSTALVTVPAPRAEDVSSTMLATMLDASATPLEVRLVSLFELLENRVCSRLDSMELNIERLARDQTTSARRCDAALETAANAAADAHCALGARIPELRLASPGPPSPTPSPPGSHRSLGVDSENNNNGPEPRVGANIPVPTPTPPPRHQKNNNYQIRASSSSSSSLASAKTLFTAASPDRAPNMVTPRAVKPAAASSPDIVDITVQQKSPSPVKLLFERNAHAFEQHPDHHGTPPPSSAKSNFYKGGAAATPAPASAPSSSSPSILHFLKKAASPMRRRRRNINNAPPPPPKATPPKASADDDDDSAMRAHAAMKAISPVAPPPPPMTIRVPADEPTIQRAIDATPPGGRVWIARGTYHEGLIVSRALEIVGEAVEDCVVGVIIEPSEPSVRALLVTPTGVLCARRVAFRCAPCRAAEKPCAAVGVKAGTLELFACELGSPEALSGVNAQRGATLRLRDVRATRCKHTGALVSGRGTRAEIFGGDFAHNGSHGLEVQDGAQVTAHGAALRENGLFGAFVSDASTVLTLDGGVATLNKRCGVWVQSGAHADLEKTALTGNAHQGLALSEPKSTASLFACDVRNNGLAAFANFNGADIKAALKADANCLLPAEAEAEAQAQASPTKKKKSSKASRKPASNEQQPLICVDV